MTVTEGKGQAPCSKSKTNLLCISLGHSPTSQITDVIAETQQHVTSGQTVLSPVNIYILG